MQVSGLESGIQSGHKMWKSSCVGSGWFISCFDDKHPATTGTTQAAIQRHGSIQLHAPVFCDLYLMGFDFLSSQ